MHLCETVSIELDLKLFSDSSEKHYFKMEFHSLFEALTDPNLPSHPPSQSVLTLWFMSSELPWLYIVLTEDFLSSMIICMHLF